VRWHVLSVDTHKTEGNFTFSGLICRIKARSSALTGGRPPRTRDFQRQ
jgi:hypothetical protein